MNKKIFAMLLVATMVLSVGCGSSDSAGSTGLAQSSKNASFVETSSLGLADEAPATVDYDYEEDSYESSAGDAGTSEDVDLSEYDMDRKLVYTSDISLETKKFEDDVKAVTELVKANGGYLQNTSTYGSAEYGNRSANLNARIPADKYQDFMNSVGQIGSLTSKSESVDDITANYVDVQARLKSLNTKLQRLQELEANAENVTELLEIEDRINEVQYQIETYTAQKKVYDDQVQYSTVNVDISEVVTYTEVKADSAWNRFTEAFGESWVGFVTFLQNIVIAIIYLIPYIILIGVVIALIVFRVKRKKKKNKNKNS